ncbi:hypothetical protein [Methanorbis furvi]|uniref:Uncharacterized protein n=1 Tax=Methanorbis furvi TaxID=3028299 RepID=A0AAE4MF69_9EURY|nr:hypothetical protein [Methanocorpusculaceae archaeon Ag1]
MSRYLVCPNCGLCLEVSTEPTTATLKADHRLVCPACEKGMVLVKDHDAKYDFVVAYRQRDESEKKIKEIINESRNNTAKENDSVEGVKW